MENWQPLFIDTQDAQRLQRHLSEADLLGRTLRRQQAQLDAWLATPLEIPGHGEGGGPEHTRHKANYQSVNLAGRFWLITGDQRYRQAVVELLSGYADLYPTLPAAHSKDTNPPGRLFHQTLNEHMWLLYAAEAYHCVLPTLSAAQRDHIENNLLRLMVAEAITTHASTFDIVHNHGLWSVAAVAICGYVLNEPQWVHQALYGLQGDSISGGFYAQLDGLFSPDGYYIEGPYYHRFGLRPLLLLAEVIERRQPELAIYQYHDRLIYRTCYALLALAYPDGTLPALNDASRTMNIRDEGAVIAVSVCWQRYGADPRLLALAQQQDTLWPGSAAPDINRALQQPFAAADWPSLQLRDGPDGRSGGVSVLRQRDGEQDLNMALLWYGQHGSIPQLHSALNHGHFDGLHLSLFNRGREYLRDYGFGRWVNIEPKFGGRYIAENNSYCKQTVAHNTVVVDQCSQNQGQSALAEQRAGESHFFISDHPQGQAMSARARGYYQGVDQLRTVLMLNLESLAKPLIVDLFQLSSEDSHQYDYCLHGRGQLIDTNCPLTSHAEWRALGKQNGYQHLWDCARAPIAPGGSARISWLDGDTFYSATGALPLGGELIIARTGAGDPHSNLLSEPAWLWRTHGQDVLFATAIESHGWFDEASEVSLQARGSISSVQVIEHNRQLSRIALLFIDGRRLEVRVNNDYQGGQNGQEAFTLNWQPATAT